jgi:hypothetical protein
MKRKIIIAGAFILFSLVLTSCEPKCKTCKIVTYIDEVYDSELPGYEYCDLELIGIEATPDVINGNMRTTYECN